MRSPPAKTVPESLLDTMEDIRESAPGEITLPMVELGFIAERRVFSCRASARELSHTVTNSLCDATNLRQKSRHESVVDTLNSK